MARDIVDDRLIGALHLRALTLRGLEHDPVAEHQAVQAGTIDAILAGEYEGDATLADVMRMGSMGIGTIQQLDGELIILDGEPWVASADSTVRRVSDDTRTPFAVVCHFAPDDERTVSGPLDWNALTSLLDSMASAEAPVVAVRVDGEFDHVELRSVARQNPPYPPLSEVVAHQTRWDASGVTGTLLGFRFPDASAGVEVPGYHLHFLSDDRQTGGHVLSLTLARGTVAVDHCDSLHVELPAGVQLGEPGAGNRAEIAAAEGDHST